MAAYKEQLDRVKRFLNRISSPAANRNDNEDYLWSFFQNCWHLRDWIVNDNSVPKAIRDAINVAAHKSETLQVCRELCNGSKHFRLKAKSRRDARIIGAIKVGAKGVSMDYIITKKSGPTRSALTVAKEAVRRWEKILSDNGL